jgi:hypothetical protein
LIKNLDTGFILDTNKLNKFYSNGSRTNKVINENSHKLKLINSLDDLFIIQDLETGFQLDSNGDGFVYLHEGNDGDYQKWKLENLYDNVYKIKNKATNLLLTTIKYGLKTQNDNGNPQQNWLLLN